MSQLEQEGLPRQTALHPHSTTSSDSPGSRNAPIQEDMMRGTLDRVVTCVATQLMQATARTADGVSEPAVTPSDSVNSAYRRNITESRGVTWPALAPAPLVSEEVDHLCRGAK